MTTQKVKPYPIAALLDLNGTLIPAEILKLTNIGFIAKTSQTVHLKVAQNLKTTFKVPLELAEHTVQIKVVKTWDHIEEAISNKEFKKFYMMEMHFVQPSSVLLAQIFRFTTRIGQK